MSISNHKIFVQSLSTGTKAQTDIHVLLRENPNQALSELLSAYGGLVYSIVRGILSASPTEEIEECVSDAFLYVYEHRQRLDFRKGSVKAYLCAAAKTRAYDYFRSAKRQDAIQEKAESVFPIESSPSAEELALANAERDELIHAILSLGEPDAEILICRYFLNLKSVEIAARTGLKPNNVDQRAGRALKKLAHHFRKGEPYAADAE